MGEIRGPGILKGFKQSLIGKLRKDQDGTNRTEKHMKTDIAQMPHLGFFQ